MVRRTEFLANYGDILLTKRRSLPATLQSHFGKMIQAASLDLPSLMDCSDETIAGTSPP